MANTDNVKEETQNVVSDTQETNQATVTEENKSEQVVENTTEQNDTPVVAEEVNTEPIINETVTPEVNNETTGEITADVQPEIVAEVPPQEPELTADEKIIADWLKNGKTEATTNDLINAGFEPENIDHYSFLIGRYKLSRMLLVSPYKIEKVG